MLRTRAARRTRVINRGRIALEGDSAIPPGLQLFRDVYSFKPIDTKSRLVESKTGKSVFRVTGLFQQASVENANGRVYPREVLADAVRAIQEDVSNRAVLGEYDHPMDAKIHLDRVSHLITKIWMDGNKVYGEAEILDSQPHGACLRGLFEQKVQVGISSRGVGDMEVEESGGKEHYRVMPGYQFVTWDCVAEPSVSGATLSVMEGLQRRVKPIQTARFKGKLSNESYERELVREIRSHFSIK